MKRFYVNCADCVGYADYALYMYYNKLIAYAFICIDLCNLLQ
jgi:hypothetical protein